MAEHEVAHLNDSGDDTDGLDPRFVAAHVPSTHQDALKELDRLLEASGHASTPDTTRLVRLIVRVTNRDLWHDGVCLRAFMTRDCRHGHDWRDVGDLSVPFTKAQGV